MKQVDFEIGRFFILDEKTYLCTDKGTRTIVAIRVDEVVVGGSEDKCVLNYKEALDEGWFNGPPYALKEYVFDEYDHELCRPIW
jgi:hypothetical protein